MTVGGDTPTVDACKRIFEVVGERIYQVGELGQGMVTKLCNNLMGIANIQIVEEALRLAAGAGIEEQKMIEIASVSSGDSWALRNAIAMRERIQRHPQGVEGARAIGRKDLALAAQLGRELPLAEYFSTRRER